MDFKAAEKYILDKLGRELPPHLTYHGIHHTRDVFNAARNLGKEAGLKEEDQTLLETAALYHDCGFTVSYDTHEEAGCTLVREVLPRFGYNPEQVERVCGLILATKVPQLPTNFLEELMCDADLDYLGRDDFEPIADSLFREFKTMKIVEDEQQWNRIQVKFLRQHHFFTPFAISRRDAGKKKHLERIEKIVQAYG
jgi:uncharacterized protein